MNTAGGAEPSRSEAWLIPPLLAAAFILAKGALPQYDGPSETRPRTLMRLLLALASVMTALHLAPLLATNGPGNDGHMESLSSLVLFGNATIADISRALLLSAIVLLPAFLALAGELRRWRPPPRTSVERVRSTSQSSGRSQDGSRRTPRPNGVGAQQQRQQQASRPASLQQRQQQQQQHQQQQPQTCQQQLPVQDRQQLQLQPQPQQLQQHASSPRVRIQVQPGTQQQQGNCNFHFPPLQQSSSGLGSRPGRGFPVVAPREASDEDMVRLATWLYFDGSAATLKAKMQQVRDAVPHATEQNGNASSSGGTARMLHEPVDDYLLARFLLAAKFEVAKAAEYLSSYLDWRRHLGGPVIPPRQWINMAAVVVPFQDSAGRPVVVLRLRYLSPSTVPLDLFELGFCATLDAVIAHYLSMRLQGAALSASREPGIALEQYACVIDATGATQKNFALPALKMMQRMATTRYPERVGKIYVLGANLGVRALWRMVKPLLLERTQGNINIIGAADVPKTFAELVGPRAAELLPPEYGGRATRWPAPLEAVTLEEKAGALAAQAWRWLGSVDPRVYPGPGGASTSAPAGPSIDGAVVSAASVASVETSVQNQPSQSLNGNGPTLPVPARRRHRPSEDGSASTNGHTNGHCSNGSRSEMSRGLPEPSNCESCFQWFRKKRI